MTETVEQEITLYEDNDSDSNIRTKIYRKEIQATVNSLPFDILAVEIIYNIKEQHPDKITQLFTIDDMLDVNKFIEFFKDEVKKSSNIIDSIERYTVIIKAIYEFKSNQLNKKLKPPLPFGNSSLIFLKTREAMIEAIELQIQNRKIHKETLLKKLSDE